MIVKKCPKCGRFPTVSEAFTIKKYKNGIRRRLCGCPNYCSVLPCKDKLDRFFFVFEGDGDDNMIFRVWNKAIDAYKHNERLKETSWEHYDKNGIFGGEWDTYNR